MNKNSQKLQKSNSLSLKQIFGAIALTTLAFTVHACAEADPQATSIKNEGGISVQELIESSDKYMGQTVTVAGEVEATIGKNLYKLEDIRLLNNQEILVFDPNPTKVQDVRNTIRADRKIMVTGEVRQLAMADLETEYGLTLDGDIKQKIERDYQDLPIVIVESMQLIEE